MSEKSDWEKGYDQAMMRTYGERKALKARIAELEAERRWIPVSERLPERDGFYLVLENVNQVAGYYHWCKVFGWNTDGGRTNIQSVTHWMPLPEPPEVK